MREFVLFCHPNFIGVRWRVTAPWPALRLVKAHQRCYNRIHRSTPSRPVRACGQVAQLVERSPEKAGVGGSIPSLATIKSST